MYFFQRFTYFSRRNTYLLERNILTEGGVLAIFARQL